MRHTRLAFALALLAGAVVPAVAQPPLPAGAQPPRPRGVQVMTLDSPAWPDGGPIPIVHTQAGRDVSPALSWSGAPEGVVSYVLVVRDLDQLVPATGEDTLHWLVWNLPATTTSLAEGMAQGNTWPTPGAGGGGGVGAPRPPTDGPRQISATGPTYRGPAAPASGPAHHYAFEIYALDIWIDVSPFGQSPATMRSAVTAAMTGHVRGKGVRVGLFRRPAP